MIKKDIHYLEYLIAREENQTISEAEAKLLANFMQDEYDRSEWDTQQMGAKAAVSAGIYKNIKKRNQSKKPFRIHYKHAVAATIALVIGLGVLLKPQPGIKEISIKTASKTDSVKLDDGTLVYLASHSEFKYPEHFDGTLRSVSLVKGNARLRTSRTREAYYNNARGVAISVLDEATLYKEMAFESYWEMYRRPQMIRFAIFPIPQTTLDVTKELKQNLGY